MQSMIKTHKFKSGCFANCDRDHTDFTCQDRGPENDYLMCGKLKAEHEG